MRRHGTLTGIAAKLKPWWMWVRLPPVLLPSDRGFAFGRAVGRQAACKAAALTGNVGSIPTGGTGRFRIADCGLGIEKRRAATVFQSSITNPQSEIPRGSFFQRPGYQVVTLAMGVRFPYEPLTAWPVRLTVQ